MGMGMADSMGMGMVDSMDNSMDNSMDVELMLPLVLILLRTQMEIQIYGDQNRSLVHQNRSQTSYHFDSCA